MSTVPKPDYKMRCDSCQRQMRPVWTMQTIRCPCCFHINTITRPQHGKWDGSSTSETGSGSVGLGNRLPSPALSGSIEKHGQSRPKKRAVICGVTYRKRKYKLRGTLNDVKNMKQLLMERFGFAEQNIRILTEEAKSVEGIPTKKNILDSLDWLVKDNRQGDSLVFYFSGHGLRKPESTEGDELDGFDETICPVDFTKEGVIIDNDINDRIVRPLVKGVTLHAIVDSCHSGTILDLPNVYDFKTKTWLDNRPPSGANKGTMGGLAISLSACADVEIAADTSALTGWKMSGAMTFSFVHAVRQNREGLTYGVLLRSMHEVIEEANKSKCLSNPILSRIFHAKLLQEPVLSSSEKFDVEKKNFQL